MSSYRKYQALLTRSSDIGHAISLLHWDLEVNMPPMGAPIRSRQIATLSGIVHDMATSPETGDLLDTLASDESLDQYQRRNVELSLKDYRRQVKLATSFVEKMTATQAEAYTNWVKARGENDFAIFAPSLDALLTLKRREAEIRGFDDEPYDAMLELYETGLRARRLDPIFSAARDAIVPLLGRIREAPQVDAEFTNRHFDKDAQWDFGLQVLKGIGYDFERGRQDLSPHPFTISFSPDDVRVTTRVDENDFSNMLWSCIHEGGHALYEQGLPLEQYGLPLGQSVSLAIHESQSRLWENHVGRSLGFWEHWYPRLQKTFPKSLADVSLESFYRGINRILPNLIRTEADELHYHLHVMIRYEIERMCINDSIDVYDLPGIWNAKYKEYMDIDVPDDDMGILQDVHWSHGSFGYFPTYSLGSFYAAQFYDCAVSEVPAIQSEITSGTYSKLLQWLRSNIHAHGRTYDPEVLCERITGKPLDTSVFVDYATDKYANIYSLNSPFSE